MDITTLLILIGATYGLSQMLVNEKGPYEILEEFRYLIGIRYDKQNEAYGTNEFAKLFTCIYCLSFWIALIIAISFWIVPVYTTFFCLPLALWTGVFLVTK